MRGERHTVRDTRCAIMSADLFDVAVIGGGPAGLCAALILGRSRRRVVVFDHGRPRNLAATAVHGYLGLDGVSPLELRQRGRSDCEQYGVQFVDDEVTSAERRGECLPTVFDVKTRGGQRFASRKLLLATGVVDELPRIPGFNQFYGRSVHHCPYCDGWEHRDKRLVALGPPDSATDLAKMLRNWSPSVVVATHGDTLTVKQRSQLEDWKIAYCERRIARMEGTNGAIHRLLLDDGSEMACDAIFFSAPHHQTSPLPARLGCAADDRGNVESQGKQGSGRPGVFLAGDADRGVQFAIVAAAEGAMAATAILTELLKEGSPAVGERSEKCLIESDRST
jgi:thioredoxin reductase